jgi:hypothetical protein
MRIKSFKLFESSEDVNYIISTTKDMLLELNFLDIDTKCELVPYGLKKVNFESNLKKDDSIIESPDIIVINLSKKAIKLGDGIGDGYKASYTWSDIKSVMDPIIDYLKEEGFLYRKDKGTLSYEGIPIISTSGSARLDNIKSKVEMWFVR